MMKVSYNWAKEVPNTAENIKTVWGEGTEFKAVSIVSFDEETGMWDGFLVFVDKRFSPPAEEIPGFQFSYRTPEAGNGVLAEIRAGDTWKTLRSIFTSLMQYK